MTGPIKIGFLSPYPGVHPYCANQTMAGIRLGLYAKGGLNFYQLPGVSWPVTDMAGIKTQMNKIYKTAASQGNGLRFDSPDFRDIKDGCTGGWRNPYLCI